VVVAKFGEDKKNPTLPPPTIVISSNPLAPKTIIILLYVFSR
jgi:hypothetical protein